ncbi:MAG TPA: SprB repeat-containing protein, partial [Chitinophagaceae bacterium]|nr:SprB repeat-containing protein [Chitinophagaceae bacterium]
GNYVTTATTCATAANGSITFTVSSGVAPFTVQLDGGTVMNGTGPFVFNNVAAGAHSISVVDAVGCSNIFSNIMVIPGPALIANNTATATTCNGASNGTISVMPSNGAAPYTFSLDGAAPVSGMPPYMFTNVNAGLHTIQVFDAVGCSSVIYNVTVDPGPSLTTTLSKTDVLCNGDATGIITINQPPLGMSPFEYSIDGTNWQTSNVFSGLLAGNYTAFYRSFNSCMGSSPITIAEPLALSASSSTVPVVCNGENNGIITMAASGGVSPYQYSIDGGASWQSSTQFNVTAGLHTITIRDVNNCITTRDITVTEPALLTAFSTNSNATCDGGDDGRVVVNASGGNSGYQYSLNGGSFQSLN